MGSKRGWVPNRDEADSALAVEALLPTLRKKARRPTDVLWRILGASGPSGGFAGTSAGKPLGGTGQTHLRYSGGATGRGGDVARGAEADRLGDLELAVTELADDLSEPERADLRQSGQLPDWFLPKVEAHAKQIRKDFRSRR